MCHLKNKCKQLPKIWQICVSLCVPFALDSSCICLSLWTCAACVLFVSHNWLSDTCYLRCQHYHLWLFGVQRSFIFHMVCFLAWSSNVTSHIYTDSVDRGMCNHISSFLCNLGVECELAMMKGVPHHSRWLQFTLMRLKKPSHQTLSLCSHVLGPPSWPDLRKFFRISLAFISLMESPTPMVSCDFWPLPSTNTNGSSLYAMITFEDPHGFRGLDDCICGSIQERQNQVSGYKNVEVSVLHLEYYVIVYDYDLACTIKLSFCAAVRRVLSDSWGIQV